MRLGLLLKQILHATHCLVSFNQLLKIMPPARPLKAQIEQGRVQAIEEETVRLRADVAKANFAQVKTLIERDMQTLKDKLPGAQDSARETALDMKYIRDRQTILSL